MSIWPKEPKGLGIRAATKPAGRDGLSGVVILSLPGGRTASSYISFGASLLETLGKHMPYGIGSDHASYLKIKYDGNTYKVFCSYLWEKDVNVHLWDCDALPSWVRNISFTDDGEEDDED